MRIQSVTAKSTKSVTKKPERPVDPQLKSVLEAIEGIPGTRVSEMSGNVVGA